MLPSAHKKFLDHALTRLKADDRILGVAAAGSWPKLDNYSDLDLVIACDPASYEEILDDRMRIAGELGKHMVSFTGEHVGEDRLLICLYEDPLLHVDLKFISITEFSERWVEPEILWEKKGLLTAALANTKPTPPAVDLQWTEDRFWVWMHYGAMRLGRGEIFEAIDLLSFLRSQVLGPLALTKKHQVPMGVRRLEQHCPEEIEALRATVPQYSVPSCLEALRASAKVYVDLRETMASDNLKRHRRVEMAAMQALHQACGD